MSNSPLNLVDSSGLIQSGATNNGGTGYPPPGCSASALDLLLPGEEPAAMTDVVEGQEPIDFGAARVKAVVA